MPETQIEEERGKDYIRYDSFMLRRANRLLAICSDESIWGQVSSDDCLMSQSVVFWVSRCKC